MTALVVFENHDVYLEHPTRANVPREINTLAHFLDFVSAHIAAFSGDATAAGRYRFVYSLKGKPLWRVADCLAAGEVVVSCTPGFLQRKHNTVVPPADSMEPNCIAEVSLSTPPPSSFPVDISSSANTKAESDVNILLPHEMSSIRKGPNKGVTDSVELDRTVVTICGRSVVLPPIPRFADPSLDAAAEMRHSEKVAAVRVLLSLKLLGRPFPESELLFREELHSRLSPIVEKAISIKEDGDVATRVVIEGPPKSGVSTTLAHCCHMAVSAPNSRLLGCLFLPLNFEMLFDSEWLQTLHGKKSETKTASATTEKQHALLLDVPFFFLTLVRVVIDAAVAQRPSLRDDSQVLVEAWEQLVTNGDNIVPDFADPRLTQVVGHRAIYEWEAFAAAAVQILRALKASPQDIMLRDVFIEMVLVRFVSHVASALRFSGVVYIIDGLRLLAGVLQHRLRRSLGDAGVLIQCLTQHRWAHVFAAVDILVFPPSTVLFPLPFQCVRLLHLVSLELLINRYGFPVAIRCGDKRFPLQILMGVPGYLKALHDLLVAHDWIPLEQGEGTQYTLRVEDCEVLYALESLTRTLQLDAEFRLDGCC